MPAFSPVWLCALIPALILLILVVRLLRRPPEERGYQRDAEEHEPSAAADPSDQPDQSDLSDRSDRPPSVPAAVPESTPDSRAGGAAAALLAAAATGAPEGFRPANELERLLVTAVRTPTFRQMFLRELLAAEVFALGARTGSAPDGLPQLEDPRQAALRPWPGSDPPAVAVFTSIVRVEEGIDSEREEYFRVPARELFESLPEGVGVTLNPGSACWLTLSPEELDDLVGGRLA